MCMGKLLEADLQGLLPLQVNCPTERPLKIEYEKNKCAFVDSPNCGLTAGDHYLDLIERCVEVALT